MKLILSKHLKAGRFFYQENISPVRIQLQLSALHPDPEVTKAPLSLLTVQNVGSVLHGLEERADRVNNKARCNFFFRLMFNMFHNN